MVLFKYIFGPQDIFAWSGFCSMAEKRNNKKSTAVKKRHGIEGV
jgi:hypothetical protein